MSELKILIADDEVDTLDVMAKKISAEGYQVVKATDGKKAWFKIISESPDIIILDLNMPSMNGFEVLEKLRKEPPSNKWQPVIIVSARNEMEDMQKGFSMEADHYLTKPCQMEDILKAIKLMLNLIPSRKSKFELDSESKS